MLVVGLARVRVRVRVRVGVWVRVRLGSGSGSGLVVLVVGLTGGDRADSGNAVPTLERLDLRQGSGWVIVRSVIGSR